MNMSCCCPLAAFAAIGLDLQRQIGSLTFSRVCYGVVGLKRVMRSRWYAAAVSHIGCALRLHTI